MSDNWPTTKPVQSFRERLMAVTRLQNLQNIWTGGFNIQISSAAGNDRGGICSDIIIGITSFGKHAQCLGNGYAYRVDQEELIEWILGIAETVREGGMITIAPLE